MKSKKSGPLTLLAMVPLFASPFAAAAESGTLITFDVPGAAMGTGCFGCTFAINQYGEVAGTYNDANDTSHGFVRSPKGDIITFEAPGADTTPGFEGGTAAQGINDSGEVTGYYEDAAEALHGYVLSPHGAFTDFDALSPTGLTIPVFISADGAVVGYALDRVGQFYSFLRGPNGNLVPFNPPDSCVGTPRNHCGSEVTYVAASGTSIGNYADDSPNHVHHGLIRTVSGVFSSFNAPGAGTGSEQGTGCPGCNMGSNAQGAIAGIYTDSNNVYHSFTRSPDGTFTTIDVPGAGTEAYQGTGCYSDCPVGLNDSGTVTGSYADANNTQHGFVRTAEGRLVTIDPPGTILTQPEAINDSGVVVGYWVDANDLFHGFIWTP